MIRFAVALVVVFAVQHAAPKALAAEAHHHHHHESLPASAPAETSIFNLDQTWTNDAGAKVTLASLQGQPIVSVMIYTSCEAACPTLVSDMLRIAAALPEAARSRVRFVLFSFDPDRDTTKRLADYRRKRTLAPERWTLLRTNADDVRDLAAVFGLKYKRMPNGDYQHSNLISILDGLGVIRQQTNGLGESTDSAVALLKSLTQTK